MTSGPVTATSYKLPSSYTSPTAAGRPQLPSLPAPSNLTATGATHDLRTGQVQTTYGQDPNMWSPGMYGGSNNTYATSSAGYTLNPFQQEEQMVRLKADLAQQARNNALAQFNAAMKGMSGPGAASGDADLDRFEALQYGRAKDIIGKQKLGAMKAFTDSMNARGLYGSTDESAGAGEIVAGANDDLSDLVLNQVGSRITRAREVNDRNFAAQEDYRRAVLNALSSAFSSAGSLY